MAGKRGNPNFKPGVSGNPNGRPKGLKNKATIIAQDLLDGDSEKITKKCIQMAMKGHPVALKLAMERIIPPRKIIEFEDVTEEKSREQILDELRTIFAKYQQ